MSHFQHDKSREERISKIGFYYVDSTPKQTEIHVNRNVDEEKCKKKNYEQNPFFFLFIPAWFFDQEPW